MRLGLLVALAPALFGCANTTTTTTTTTTNAQVTVLSDTFLGGVTCGPGDGALHAYVATVFDLTTDGPPFPLPSSRPVPCTENVSFAFVAPDHTYAAEIDGYDVPIVILGPFGGESSGSRRMIITSNGALATPRYRASCTPVTAVQQENVNFSCDALVDEGTPGPSSIAVDPAGFADECSSARYFLVSSPLVTKPTEVRCGQAAAVFDAGVLPGHEYTFHVRAIGPLLGNGDPEPVIAETDCVAVAVAGVQVTAKCAGFAFVGAVKIDASSLPGTSGLTCLAKPDQAPTDAPASATFPCDEGAIVTQLTIGPHHIDVAAKAADGSTTKTFGCDATVASGALATAVCK